MMVSRVQGGSGQKRLRTLKGNTEIQFITRAPSCHLLEHRGGQVRFCSFSSGSCSSDTCCPVTEECEECLLPLRWRNGNSEIICWSVMLEQTEKSIIKSIQVVTNTTEEEEQEETLLQGLLHTQANVGLTVKPETISTNTTCSR